ncbi:MAG: 23S rRNA (uracil(1939)-C(5))-methyltransferase RlmD [Burkholderiaceae bacterium]
MSERYRIDSVDLDANGVARSEGKVTFVRGALPGETVTARIVRRKPRFDVAEIETIERGSVLRVTPRCPHYGTCGGCSMQHVEPRAQVSIKQRALEDTLWHVGRVKAETALPPIVGPAYGYRYRARLSVRYVPKKGGVLVGFHERGSSYVADMRECHVLPPAVARLLLPLRELVEGLSIRDRMPQVEVALGETVLALVFRVLEPLTEADRTALTAFSATHALEVWLQYSGPDTIELFAAPGGGPSTLHYALPEFGVTMPFRPTDFTQVNPAINRTLVARAIGLLDPSPTDRVADLFCGLGNFTLPLATRAREVVGIEGSATLVGRALANARANRLDARASFQVANLFELTPRAWRALGHFDRVLVDPPREGALAVAQALSAPESPRPRRLVYVSCNPATLARDAQVLVGEGGWRLRMAGVVNMFPHTSHVESMAVFEPSPEAPAP